MSRLKDLFKKSTNESAKTEEINEAQFVRLYQKVCG